MSTFFFAKKNEIYSNKKIERKYYKENKIS